MATSAVTASWALAQTTSDAVSIGVAALQAATTDNIQVVALVAAEAFGTTLPMCQQSKSKVYQLCSRDQQSAITNFFKARIGYSKGDSGWQLCQSDPGCRFIALAACLLTINHWQAAEILRECIQETAENKTLVPTSQQLKQLLQVLQDRLAHAGFLNSVLEWNRLLLAEDRAFAAVRHSWRAPPPPTIAKLIKGISQIARLGESHDNSYVQLDVEVEETAWTIAFVRWCLGSSPTVILKDKRAIFEQPDAIVVLRVDKFEIKSRTYNACVVHTVDNVSELVSCLGETKETRVPSSVRGMTSIHNFCQDWRQRHFDEADESVCRELLAHACHLAVTSLRVRERGQKTRQCSTRSLSQEVDNFVVRDSIERSNENPALALESSAVRFEANRLFSDRRALSRAMKKFLDIKRDEPLELGPSPCRRVADLLARKSHQESLSPQCDCAQCKQSNRTSARQWAMDSKLLPRVYDAVTIVLIVSLLESFNDDEILVSSRVGISSMTLRLAVKTCIENSSNGYYDLEDVTGAILPFVGQRVPHEGPEDWVMSSCNGQTIYPKMLEDLEISGSKALKFRCIPGSIYWKQHRFEYVLQSHTTNRKSRRELEMASTLGSDLNDDGCLSVPQNPPISLPEDDYPGFLIEWSVHALEKSLRISVTCPSLSGWPNRQPMNAIRSAMMSVGVNCPHDSKAPLSEHVPHLYRGNVVKPFPKSRRKEKRAIIMCAENVPARFFALTSPGRFIIREDACLHCCIEVSRTLQLSPVLC